MKYKIFEWSIIIRDKDLLDKLASGVFTKIFDIQKQMIEMIRLGTVDNIPDPIAREVHEIKFFELSKALVKSMVGWGDLDEISQFYENAGLKKEVKPVMNSLSQISKNLPIIRNDSDLSDKLSISDPLSWSAETIYEFNNPDKYYKDILNAEFDE